ncbi:MAG: hypothetical protein K2K92_03785 [Duncaniella sp.]|nr:hypothetical protein [Duncaniella sp.]
MKKALFSVLAIVALSGACFVANAVMSDNDTMSESQVDNANALMSEAPAYDCLNDTENDCVYICHQCGAIVYLYGTGRVVPSGESVCPSCGNK